MKKLGTSLLLLFTILSCVNKTQNRANQIVKEFQKSNSSNVIVTAHRGDWRHTPENSLVGIENCIKMGVDIVEVDVHKTKDNKMVLMHDETIDRMTTGKGKISDYTLEELKQFYLKNNKGGENAELTNQRIPTLEEALLTSKDRIMIILDKSYDFIEDIYPVLIKTGTVNTAILKAKSMKNMVSAHQTKKDLAFMKKSVLFMSMIKDTQDSATLLIREHIMQYRPAACEMLLFKSDSLLSETDFMRKQGCRVWVNTLWATISAGYSDDKAVKDPDANWGHLIEKGVNIIQTDNPTELLQYLERKGLRNF
jgi:glycerophosphoryl diester phosphodiesterase